MPRLAPASFRTWARHGEASRRSGGDVILWVDTFNNSFHPETSRGRARRADGRRLQRVHPAASRLCCGRPLYDFGLLDQAMTYLRRILDALADPIDAGMPIVVLEPSCASVFRDELRNLLPADPRAARLRGADVSAERVPRAARCRPTRRRSWRGRVLLHGHCHHKALMKMGDEESLLRKMGADVQSLDAGCCGMAGSVRLRRRQVRRVAGHRRARAAAGGPHRPPPTRSSCRTASAAASRSRRRPAGRRFTSPTRSKSRCSTPQMGIDAL